MSLFKAAWTNSISRAFGKFASTEFPSAVQMVINYAYVKLMGVDLSAFEDIDHYKSLNALFTRKLIYNRGLTDDPNAFISPADSLVTAEGDVKDAEALQIKGFSYSVRELLTEHFEPDVVAPVEHGKYINFYLSPKDYHRYHAPIDMRVLRAVHVPGALYPVNLKYLRKVPSLFVKNERVILECVDNANQLFFIVLVGALNVGKMTLSFDKRIETNTEAAKVQVYDYDNVTLRRGDELGMFMMGSTIVLLFEEGFVDLVENLEGRKVRFGDVVAYRKSK
ncbi:MAG: phosphatidylserine decarboxylase [Sulfurospirillum sp.]|nr:MAG: phosphatidylserine decarboxylase [Sulfurospirillum sp.]